MTKLAPEWVRTSDPVIRSPARYRWTTAPAQRYVQNIICIKKQILQRSRPQKAIILLFMYMLQGPRNMLKCFSAPPPHYMFL